MTKQINLLKLPYDVLRKIMIDELSIRDILSVCSINKDFNTDVCNDDFWRQIANKRFKISNKRDTCKSVTYKSVTCKDLVIRLDFSKELTKRFDDLIAHFEEKSPYYIHIKKEIKFWEVFEGDAFIFKINVSTGDVYLRDGTIHFNIMEDPYGGKGHFYIDKNDGVFPEGFDFELVKNLPKYESIISLTKKDLKKYTLKDLEGKTEKELIQIYRDLGLKGEERKLTIKDLKESIISGKNILSEYPKYNFKVGQNVVLHYNFEDGIRKYFFGKVISNSEFDKFEIQLYEKEKKAGLSKPINKLTNTIFETRYSKYRGYLASNVFNVASPEEIEFSFDKEYYES